jgi:hypothetical protein
MGVLWFSAKSIRNLCSIKNGGAMMSHKKYECAVCGREVSRGEYETMMVCAGNAGTIG